MIRIINICAAMKYPGVSYHQRSFYMNWNEIEGKWDRWSGKLQEKWGKLTNDDWTVVKGKRDQLVGKLKEKYGYVQAQAEKEIEDFLDSCKSDCCSSSQKAKSTDEESSNGSCCN
jgi:uncharacterized protein YjbJ (UPF0337 family)